LRESGTSSSFESVDVWLERTTMKDATAFPESLRFV
jgi:hypothetical protein